LDGGARGIHVVDDQERFAGTALRFVYCKSATNVLAAFHSTQTDLGERRAMADEDVSPEGNPHTLTDVSGECQGLIKLADA